MDDFKSTIAAGKDDAYLAFSFIHKQDGERMRAGGSEGLRSFLYWFDSIKETGNKPILELFLWKFFVYLPEIARRIIADKFRREGLSWELQQLTAAATFRGDPSQDELASPPIEHSRWVSAPTKRSKEETTWRSWLRQNPILILPLLAAAGLSVIALLSLLQGDGVWRRFGEFLGQLYNGIFHQTLHVIVGTAYPSTWIAPPNWIYDGFIAAVCFYVCYLVVDRFGQQEIATIASMRGAPGKDEPESAVVSAVRHVLRHCLVFVTGPLVFLVIVASYFVLRRDYRRREAEFHINLFKVHLVSHGISLTQFDDATEVRNFAYDRQADFKRNQAAIMRATLLYLSPVFILISALSLTVLLSFLRDG